MWFGLAEFFLTETVPAGSAFTNCKQTLSIGRDKARLCCGSTLSDKVETDPTSLFDNEYRRRDANRFSIYSSMALILLTQLSNVYYNMYINKNTISNEKTNRCMHHCSFERFPVAQK